MPETTDRLREWMGHFFNEKKTRKYDKVKEYGRLLIVKYEREAGKGKSWTCLKFAEVER